MNQKINLNGKTILESNDNVSINMIWNNIKGVNFRLKSEYKQYLKHHELKKGDVVEKYDDEVLVETITIK